MKNHLRLGACTLLFALLGAFLWAFWATRGACHAIEWFLEALIMTVTFRVPIWVWCLSGGAYFAVRLALARRKARMA